MLQFTLKSFFQAKNLLLLTVLVVAFIIRSWNVAQLPPSPYWEEVAIGYDAYSILKTGKDHHGNPFPVVAFESFGDFKPTLYFYAVVPFIAILGLNVLAIRMPSVIAGTLIVWGVGLIAQQIANLTPSPFKTKTKKTVPLLETFDIRLVTMLVTALSPWAIQFSRAGWEVNLATCLVVYGVYFGLQSLKRFNMIALLCSAVLFVLSMYTYHATRIIAPLLGFSIVIPWFVSLQDKSIRNKTIIKLIMVGFIASLLSLPLLLSLNQTSTNQRFAETSIFNELSIIQESNQLIAEDGSTVVARLAHHRYLLFGREMLKNALNHFHPNFLFISGDSNPRHSIQLVGHLYIVEAGFLLLGIYSLMKKNKRAALFLSVWLVIVLLPVSMTKATPHALRTLPMMPVFMFVVAQGIQQLLAWSPNPKWCYSVSAIIGVIYIGLFAQFWHAYTKIYPQVYGQEWQYGYQEMVSAVNELREPNEDVYITREQGRPAMYYWFYSQIEPKFVQEFEAIARKDQGEFLQFEKIHFVDGLNGQEQGLIVSSEEKSEVFLNKSDLKRINNLHNETVWKIYRTQ